MVFYFLIIPAIITPDWCLEYYDNQRNVKDGLLLECWKAYDGNVIYSNVWKVKPVVSATLDILCLIYLCVFRFCKLTWSEKPTRKRIIQNWIFFICVLICIGDSIGRTIAFEYPFINNLLRPVIVVLFFSSIRTNLRIIWHDF